MNNNTYSEVLDVLSNMDEKYKNMIPKKLMDFFNSNKNLNYKEHISPNVELSKQNISKEAITILAMVNLNYWIKDENHRKELVEKYKSNNVLKDEDIKIYEIFEEKPKNELIIKHDATKKSFFEKIIIKIKKIFEK